MNATTLHLGTTVRSFSQRLPCTRHGASRARRLATGQLATWQMPPGIVERAEQIVAELAANAALHGRVRGRGFRLTLTFDAVTGVLRVALIDARGERLPVRSTDCEAAQDAESGRGLFLVTALADRWGTEPYPPSGKAVWADLHSTAPYGRCPRDFAGSSVPDLTGN